jgi:alpha-tubulin suppressor-like RCC1 family protein
VQSVGVSNLNGNSFTMVVKTNGSLWACGQNDKGQLGCGNTTNQWTPIQILNSGVRSVSVGFNHTLIVKTDSTLWACGDNSYGQLGIYTSASYQNVFGNVTGSVAAASAGYSYSMVIRSNGSLWGCGNNPSGQIGDGTQHGSGVYYNLSQVISSGAQSVATSFAYTLIAKTDGSFWACGYNDYGEFGMGTAAIGQAFLLPTQINLP